MKELINPKVKRTELSFIRENTPQFTRAYVKYCTTEPITRQEIEKIKSTYEGEASIERRSNQVCVIIEKLRARPSHPEAKRWVKNHVI